MDKDLTYDEWTQKVKIGILTEAGNCPVTSLIIMLQGKWKFQIIYEMCIKSPIRFGELRKTLTALQIQCSLLLCANWKKTGWCHEYNLTKFLPM